MFKIGAVGRRVELPFLWIGIGFCPLIQALLCVGGGPQWPVALSHCLFVSWHGCVSYNFGFSMEMNGVDHTMMPFSFFLILLFISFSGV